MIATLQQILERALDRLAFTATAYVPPLLAGLVIFLGALLIATLVRWMLTRLIRTPRIERFLLESGLASMLGAGRLRATPLIAGAAYWMILLIGLLTGLSAFDTALTSRIIEGVVFSLPNLLLAGLIVLAGAWLGQYLGRSMLVWACNEGLPSPRRLAAAVRALIVFAAAVVAADQLNFARNVFLLSFLLVVGGGVLAASIALGLAAHSALERHFKRPAQAEEEKEKSFWNHL